MENNSKFNMFRKFCRMFRIIIGSLLIVVGILLGDTTFTFSWFYLGAIPLVMGIVNFCPLCFVEKFKNRC